MINDDRIPGILERLAKDGSADEQLAFVDALTHLPLSEAVWRGAAAPLAELLATTLEGREQPYRALQVFARVPLTSVRTTLRGLARTPGSPLSLVAALELASQHDGDALPRLVAELERHPTDDVAHAIACMPAERLPPFAARLRAVHETAEPRVGQWLAIALAKAFRPGDGSRDLEPLEMLWDSLVRSHSPPPMFAGDPGLAGSALAQTRPLPEPALNFLLGLQRNDFDGWQPRSSSIVDAFHARVFFTGLTGVDIEGGADRPPDVVERSAAPAQTAAAADAVESWLEKSGDIDALLEHRHILNATPPELAAKAIERALATAPRRVADDVHQGMTVGNRMLELVTALPPELPLRVLQIVRTAPEDSAVPRDVMAWVLARGGAESAWNALAPAVIEGVGPQRRRTLEWLQSIASYLQAPPPYRGAGGDAGFESAVQLIEDQTSGATRSAGGFRGATGAQPSMPAPPRAEPPPQSRAAMAEPPRPQPSMAKPPPDTTSPPRSSAPARVARFVQGVLRRRDADAWQRLADATLHVGQRYQLSVFIGPKSDATLTAGQVFPDESLNWEDREELALEVVFALLDGRAEAQVGRISLPRAGTSSTADFEFVAIRPGATRIRISILHEGRIVQTAILSAITLGANAEAALAADASTGEATARPEIVVHESLGGLRGRRRFDASLLLNETPQGLPTATAAGGGSAFIASLAESQGALADISALLQDIATNSKKHTRKLRSKENAAWLAKLARLGNVLYRNLVTDYLKKSVTAEALRDARYLQIVTAKPDAIVPLEFVYELGYPKETAELCDGAEEALAKRTCPAVCKGKQDKSNHVCPMGFWGLSRVIERHAHDPSLPKEAIVTVDGNVPRKGTLALRGVSLLAASKQVPAARVTELGEHLARLAGGVAQVNDWAQWLDVMPKRPTLFVVLPHTHGAGADIALEIGGDSLESGALSEDYVYPEGSTGSQPIVLLLGCNTAGVADRNSYARHITVFRQANSAIVLATTAEVVWGDDIAQVAELLVDRLHAVAKDSTEHFGDILRDAKCEAVLQSQLVAICLAGIGDADWRVTQ